MIFVNDIAFVEKSKHGSTFVLSVMRENKQTNKLTPWGRILCKNLTVPQAVKKFLHLMNPKIHCHIHNSPQLINIVRQNHPFNVHGTVRR